MVFLLGACRADNSGGTFSSLNSPYVLKAALIAPADQTKTCGTTPAAPQKDLILGSVYKRSDPTRSEIDKSAREIYQEQTQDLNSFENRLSAMSNKYLMSDKQDSRAATCALDWLYGWAEGDALLGEANVQGTYARQWGLATLSTSYLQVRDFVGFDAAKKRVIENWLEDIAHKVMAEYTDIEQYTRKQNNHLYWAAWAVTATGIAIDNRQFYEWGVNKVKYALHIQLQDDGTLPLEMMRGQKALQYHVFALAPLIMVCETATRNGENLYQINNGAIHKLVDRAFEGLSDSSYFKEKSGHEQLPGSGISSVHFSWLEVYNARFQDRRMEQFLKKHRRVISRRTGGDMTFLYAHL